MSDPNSDEINACPEAETGTTGSGRAQPSPPTSVTRRTFLGATVGLAAWGAAVVAAHGAGQTGSDAQTMRPKESKSGGAAAYPPPGLLAQSRLKPDVVALMTDATRFSARRRKALSDYIPKGMTVGAGSLTVPSSRFMFAMPGLTPKPDQGPMARRLADIVLRDELWTGEPSWRSSFTPDFEFTFADAFPGVTVAVCPAAHEIRLEWINQASHAVRSDILLFDPVGREMTAFIKDAFPGDPAAQSLTFTPAPAPPPVVVPQRPAQVSPDVWAKVLALRPGMTRADLTRLFGEEGGISNRLHRTYVLKNSRQGARYLKINAQFAPANVPLLWRNGKGYLRNPEDRSRISLFSELPGDIITSLSPVYWGYFHAG